MTRLIATAGHVDHGKSALVEALTGTHPDRWEEERRRGLTIDLGFAHGTLPGGEELSIIDVPGHHRFLANMLAGVGAVDAALLVVAANEGWKPQSEEHLRILQLLGVEHGLVAVTKSDLAADGGAATIAAVRARVVGTFLADAPIVAVSAVSGAGIDELRFTLEAVLAAVPAVADGGRPRLWIDRAFTIKGAGRVVTGTLLGGSLTTGQELSVVPGGAPVRVRGLQSHGAEQRSLAPGHRAALNLSGAPEGVRRGDALVVAGQWRPSALVDASLDVLASLDHPVSRRGAYVAFVGSGEFPVTVRILGPEELQPGERGAVRLHLPHVLPLVRGDRYVLRESGRDETVGGGEVLDVAPVLPAARARPDHDTERIVAEHGAVDVADLEAWTGERRAPDVGTLAVSPVRLERERADLQRAVDEAGAVGLDLAPLDTLERAVVTALPGVRVEHGRAVAAAADPLAAHPAIAAARAGGLSPEPPEADRNTLRQLVVRGLLVERDGLYFHPDAVDRAAAVAADLLRAEPSGFTMSRLREALGVSRKFALPLANELDQRRITLRRGDLRIAGPNLPAGPS